MWGNIRNSRGLRAAALLVSMLALAACQKDDTDPVKAAEADLLAKPRPAKLFTVSDHAGLLSRRFTGRVEPVKTVDLSFQVAGKLESVPVRESERVKKGDLIATLDPTDYARSVREAKLKLEQAERDLKRLETLHERSVISDKSYDDQKNTYDLAEESLEAAEQNLKYTKLYAPFDGIITRRLEDNFTTVSVGTPVIRMQDVSEVQIDINVPEALFTGISEDRLKDIYAEFQAIPNKRFPLEYREHLTEVDDVTQTYRVTLAMPTTPDMTIYPGMSATVVATVLAPGIDPRNSLLVPTEAIAVDSDEKPYVWRYNADNNTVHATPVEVGVVAGSYIPVLSGVSEGEKIVSAGVAYLHDGQTIRPLN